MKLKRRIIIIVCLVLVFIMTVAFLAGRHMLRTDPTWARRYKGPIPVQVAAAKKTALTEILGAEGEVQPSQLVNLTTRISAPVEDIAVDIGDLVSPGQVLLHFDREILNAAQRAAQSAVDQAAGEMERAAQQYKRIKAIYDQGLSSIIIKAAQSAVDQAAGEMERAAQQYKRIKAICDQGLLPKIELEKAEAERDKAKAEYSKAEEMLLRAKKDLQIEPEKAKAERDKAKAEYSKAEEMLLRAKKDLQDATMVSPVLGIVMERLINPGETPSGMQRVFTIGKIDQVLVEAKIAEEKVGEIHLQQSAAVTFNAFPNDLLEGKVVKVKPVTDPNTRTFLVYVLVANPDLKLKPGLTGFVRIKKEREAIAVPNISLISPTGVSESSVFLVKSGSIARLVKVKVGIVAEGMTEILEGLEEGDQVVTVGQLYLREGDQVRIGDEFDEIKERLAKKPHQE